MAISFKNYFKSNQEIGTVGYDNPRENIDPQIKTKVLYGKEAIVTDISAEDITSDNISGSAIYAGDLKHIGTFANIHVHDEGATPQDIPAGATYTKCTGFDDNGQSSNCTADAANDKITITRAGRYLVNHNSSFTGDTNNVTYFAAAFLGGAEKNDLHCVRKLGTAGDVGSMSFCGIIDVTSVPVDLDVRVRHDNVGTVEYTIEYGGLTVNYLGET